jgi:hypothetical protein
LPIQGQAVLERHPEQRFRQALVLRHHHYLGESWALRNHARLYADTYGVKALTVGTEAAFERYPLDAALSLRGYAQTRADFYRSSYDGEQRYLSYDKELSPFFDMFFGPTLGYARTRLGPFSAFRVEGRVQGFYFDYADFAALQRRYGVMADVGASATF